MLLEGDIPYKLYHQVDVSDVASRILELPEEAWLKMPSHVEQRFSREDLEKLRDVRKNKLHCTRLRIRCTDDDWIPGRYRKQFHIHEDLDEAHYLKYAKAFKENFVDEALNNYTNIIIGNLERQFDGYAGRALFARMPPGNFITAHIDPGYYMGIVHRCHIPIQTNDKVEFQIGDTIFNMKVGTLYEINNKATHSVRNLGDTDRIHLIIDIIPKDKYPN